MSTLNTDEITRLSSEIKEYITEEGLAGVDVTTITVPDDYISNDRLITAGEAGLPETPDYFKMATVKNVSKEEKKIVLEVAACHCPTCVCGDGCATNYKGAFYI